MLSAGAVQWEDCPGTEGEKLPRSMLSRKAWHDSLCPMLLSGQGVGKSDEVPYLLGIYLRIF